MVFNFSYFFMIIKQYSSVFTQPMESYEFKENDNSTSQLSDIDLTEADFINEINTLSSNSAPGPDGFPAILLKKPDNNLQLLSVLSGETS